MRELNLNIDLDIKGEKNAEGKDVTCVEMAILWIGVMLERSLNKPDPKTNRPTAQVGMEQQRKYYKIMTALEANVDGIVKMEDADYSFLSSKYHQAEMPIQKGTSKGLVVISDAINSAKEV